ncbi:PD40 domain-containing protein [Arenicella xantha]|nr:PD40 domain-containing protein [Arenicella xantha]
MRTSISTVMLLAFFSMGAQAQTPYQLSAPMVPFGDATYLNTISPDNKRVVYTADQDTDNIEELYSVSLKGGVVTKLNSVLPMGFNVKAFLISSDSKYVVYRTRNDSTGKRNLFSVPIQGGAAVQLNTNNHTYDLSDYRITNDGQRVVYLAYNATSDAALFSLRITGGTPVNITPSSEINPSLFNLTFFISPDDQRVIFTVRVNGGQPELFSVPVAGGTIVNLNRPLTTSPSEKVTRFPAISPNSQTVVYAIKNNDASTTELYSTPMVVVRRCV